MNCSSYRLKNKGKMGKNDIVKQNEESIIRQKKKEVKYSIPGNWTKTIRNPGTLI